MPSCDCIELRLLFPSLHSLHVRGCCGALMVPERAILRLLRKTVGQRMRGHVQPACRHSLSVCTDSRAGEAQLLQTRWGLLSMRCRLVTLFCPLSQYCSSWLPSLCLRDVLNEVCCAGCGCCSPPCGSSLGGGVCWGRRMCFHAGRRGPSEAADSPHGALQSRPQRGCEGPG